MKWHMVPTKYSWNITFWNWAWNHTILWVKAIGDNGATLLWILYCHIELHWGTAKTGGTISYCSVVLTAYPSHRHSGIFSNRLHMWWFIKCSKIRCRERERERSGSSVESWIMRWTLPKHYYHSRACSPVSSASPIFCHFPPPPPSHPSGALLHLSLLGILWNV